MKFGPLAIDDAEGAILAHSSRLPTGTLKKGTVLTADHIRRLREAGIESIVVAALEADDIDENLAATRVAALLKTDQITAANAFSGRVNLFAVTDGLLLVNAAGLIALNSIDEGLTIATLPPSSCVSAGQMIATIKIIPYAISAQTLEQAAQRTHGTDPILTLAPFTCHNAALIQTSLEDTKPTVHDKRKSVTEARLNQYGSQLSAACSVAHQVDAVQEAIIDFAKQDFDPILIFGGAAIADRGDIIPQAVLAAGGQILHVGMPVDPGNLLLLAQVDNKTIIGIPSCAASPKLNGFDWVLQRSLANLETTSHDIAAMAPGGLLKEIATRPQPRDAVTAPDADVKPRIAAIILAAGRSSRMGAQNKLIQTIDGAPMVRHVAQTARQSGIDDVIVVTGNEPGAIAAALDGFDVRFCHNPDFKNGLATSLATGIAALDETIDGVVVLLGDMPFVPAALLDDLIAAFDPSAGRNICVPTRHGKRGNPVLWGSPFFTEMREIRGDTGAKHLLGQHGEQVVEVEATTDAIFLDIDTPDALIAARTASH